MTWYKTIDPLVKYKDILCLFKIGSVVVFWIFSLVLQSGFTPHPALLAPR